MFIAFTLPWPSGMLRPTLSDCQLWCPIPKDFDGYGVVQYHKDSV